MAANISDSIDSEPAAAAGPSLGAVQAWQSTNGALTRSALLAILDECAANWGGVAPDCQAAARAGAGNFSVLPDSARREFAFLFQESCPPGGEVQACVDAMEALRVFRSFPRGRLDPQPATMNEGVRTLFTAFVRDPGELEGGGGERTDVAFEPVPAAPGTRRRVTVIPVTEQMCFRLYAEDPKTAQIEPESRPGATIERGRVCMRMAEGGGSIKFDPRWWVTPLAGNDLRLYLDAEHFVGNRWRSFPNEPRPIVINVIPKPGLWERIDTAIRRMTATVNLAVGLAQALALLFTTIAGWALWSWLKGRRAAAAATP